MADESSLSTEELMSEHDISLDSSGSEQGKEYTIEEILAERLADDSTPLYLVKWENYGEERCTWEPAESFLEPRSLRDWTKKRDADDELADDLIESIDTKMNAYLDAKAFRKARRQNKRSRLTARTSRSSRDTSTITVSAAGPSNQRSTDKTKTNSPKYGSLSPDFAQGVKSLLRNENPNHGKLVDARSSPTMSIARAKPPVFHGIGIGIANKRSHHAQRTGDQGATKTSSFRNLRHLNNARKAARRERSPDVTKIKLRSLAEWAESAPEDTSVQLPPRPASFGALADGGTVANVNPSHPSTLTSLGTQPSTRPPNESFPSRPPHESFPSRKSSNVFDITGASNSTSMKERIIGNRVDPYDGQERILRTTTNGRFFYYPGEILAEIRFGKVHIGDVRIRGLPNWAISHIIRLKVGNLSLEIGSNNLITLAQWAQLCTGRSNVLQTTGVLIPYRDTAKTVMEMEGYLSQRSFAALWYHPTEDFMLVFYSPRSSEWMFLESMGGLPCDGSIRVLTRNKMPPTEMLEVEKYAAGGTNAPATDQSQRGPVRQRTPSFSALGTADNRSPTSDILLDSNDGLPPSRKRRSSLPDAATTANPVFSPIDQSPNSARRPLLPVQKLSSSRQTILDEHNSALNLSVQSGLNDPQTDVGEPGQGSFQLALRPGQTIGEAFQNGFQISYDHLTAVPLSKHRHQDPAKARFYLEYPRTAQAELECLQTFLRSYTFHTNISTSMEERGWDAFHHLCKGDYIGVILFHEDCTHYHTLSRLASLLRSPSLNVFRVSLSQPLRECDDRIHIERLFPSGLAILLTEGSLISDGLTLLKWFRRKKSLGWKLVLRPNIKKWLRYKALEPGIEGRDKFTKLVQELNTLKPGFSALRDNSRSDGESSSEAESIDGLSDESGAIGAGPLLSPSCIPAYGRPPPANENWSDSTWKDHILVDFFAGWAATNAEFHRRFVAIATFPDSVYSKWGHIEVLKPDRFMRREGIGREQQAGALES